MRPTFAIVAALLALLACATPAWAVEDRAFTPRFATNDRGDIVFAANGLMTCPASQANCAAAQAGTATGAALNNNAYVMQQVDIDGDVSTFNSSSSMLTLPAGAQVLFAGLYYGARTTAGANVGGSGAPAPVAAPAAAARGTVLLRGPADGAYVAATAAVDDSSAVAGAYTAFADVTARVRPQGAGTYTVANVQAGTGVDRYAGWSLVVAYHLAGDTPRNLTVFDGLSSVDQADPVQEATVSGFETPPTGIVRSRVGAVAYEGDRGVSGTPLLLQGRQVGDAASPANNVFNSTIATDGLPEPGRVPAYPNLLGFDADLIRADGYLANGATSALVRESTSTEQYLTQALTLSTDLNPAVLDPPPLPAPPPPALPAPPAPSLVVDTTPPPSPLRDGATSTYVIDVANPGSTPAPGARLTYTFTGPVDVLSATTDEGSCSVRGATVTCAIGTLAPGQHVRVRIRVRPSDTGRIGRRLDVSRTGAIDVRRTASSHVGAGAAVVVLSKRASARATRPGQVVTYRIAVRTSSRASARDVRVCDRPGIGVRLLSAAGTRVRSNRACWTIAALKPGARRSFHVVARLDARFAATRVNAARVTASNARGRTAAARIRVTPLAPRACSSGGPRARVAC